MIFFSRFTVNAATRSSRIQPNYCKFKSFRGQSPLTPTRSPDPWPCQGACAAPWTPSAIFLENHFLGVLGLSERMKQKRKKKKKKKPHTICVYYHCMAVTCLTSNDWFCFDFPLIFFFFSMTEKSLSMWKAFAVHWSYTVWTSHCMLRLCHQKSTFSIRWLVTWENGIR